MLRKRRFAAALGLVAACTPGGDGDLAGTDGASSGATPMDDDAVAQSDDCADACATGEDADSATGTVGELDCADSVDNDGDGDTDCEDLDCRAEPVCADGTFRIATWNVLRIDPVGSAAYEALLAIVLRLDADVLCVQEVGEGEESQLQALAVAANYKHGLLAPASGPPGSGIANACMSRLPVADEAYLWSNWISSDPSARDLTRPFVRLRIQDPKTERYISVLSGHLKAGSEDVDRFRRMVESIRLGQAAMDESATYPGNVVVVLGDLNDRANPPPSTFTSLPSGLPSFYSLGDDISLPIVYRPGQPLVDAGLTRVEARWEDGTEEDTFIPFANRLDYIWVTGEEIIASEVYEACRDDGIDADPVGDVLLKAGDPLECGLSELASDHRPVVVEFRL